MSTQKLINECLMWDYLNKNSKTLKSKKQSSDLDERRDKIQYMHKIDIIPQ
jgi:hypothetical protein